MMSLSVTPPGAEISANLGCNADRYSQKLVFLTLVASEARPANTEEYSQQLGFFTLVEGEARLIHQVIIVPYISRE